MKKVLFKKLNDGNIDKITITTDENGSRYSITCSYIKAGSSIIYSRSKMPDYDCSWASFWFNHYLKEGYKEKI